MRNEKDIAELSEALNRAGKSAADSFSALADAAKKAEFALGQFKVACFPKIPDANNPILKQMQAIADREGKQLVLVDYPHRAKKDLPFTRGWFVFDEISDLDWRLWRPRHVVKRRCKKMVYYT